MFFKPREPAPLDEQPKGDERRKIIVRTYTGTEAGVMETFRVDAAKLAAEGYFPTSQSWAPGSYGCGAFLLALLLCIILVGLLVFIYMLIVKPHGTLTVTYELRSISATAGAELTDEKICPRCAEQVKAAALVCRFCGHEFAPER